jgi:hypothetical protein
MLGRLRMSVNDSINAYMLIMNRLFETEWHSVEVKDYVQQRFNTDELVRIVKKVVRQQGLQEDTLLKDAPNTGCKM